METFKNHPQLGRFTLRDEGKSHLMYFFSQGILSQKIEARVKNTDYNPLDNNIRISFLGKTIAIGKVLKLVDSN